VVEGVWVVDEDASREDVWEKRDASAQLHWEE
jgi:hypothetical protein